MQTLFYVIDSKNNPKPHSVPFALVYCKHPFWHVEEWRSDFARLYICVCIYICMFAKLHFVGYNLSTRTSQEKEHSSMQKYENKGVCVKRLGLGVTAVPAQRPLPRLCRPRAAPLPPRHLLLPETAGPPGECQTGNLAPSARRRCGSCLFNTSRSLGCVPAAARQSRLGLKARA